MRRWDDLAIFLAALRAGSVTRTARDLGIGITTVSRRLERLEEDLGQPLFARTSAGLSPLPAAEALRPHAEESERAMLSGRAALTTLDPVARGTVTVSLVADMTNLVLVPVLPELLQTHPEIELVLDQSAALVDLMRREADIAVRVVRPESGDELVSTRLRNVELAVFGSEAYLRQNPSTDPDDHRWITLPESSSRLPSAQWLRAAAPTAQVVLRASHPETLRLAAAAGVGLSVVPRTFGRCTPTLREVQLEAPPLPTHALWMVTHRALRHAPRVDAVWNWLADRLRDTDENSVERLRIDLARAYGLDFSVTNHSSS